MLFTIYKGKPVGSWFRQRISGKAKFKTGKFRSGIAFTMYTNQLHLPKNSRERLKLVLIKDGFEEIELEFPFGTFRPETQDYLFRRFVTPGHFPPKRPRKSCFIYFPAGFPETF